MTDERTRFAITLTTPGLPFTEPVHVARQWEIINVFLNSAGTVIFVLWQAFE